MSRNAALFDRPNVGTSAAKPIVVPATPRSRPFIELAVNLFPASEGPRVVAFGSVGQGAGVTTVIRSLAEELKQSRLQVEVLAPPFAAPYEARNILGATPVFSSARPGDTPEDVVEAARLRSDRVLVDCGSLTSSAYLLQFAPKVDGVVLIVEAGKTEKQQIERAAVSINQVGGKLLGLVMNKRQYPVPGWLYGLL